MHAVWLAPRDEARQRRGKTRGPGRERLALHRTYRHVGCSTARQYALLAASFRAHGESSYHAILRKAVATYIQPVVEEICDNCTPYSNLPPNEFDDIRTLTMGLGTHEVLAALFKGMRPYGKLTYFDGLGRYVFGVCATIYLVLMIAEKDASFEKDIDAPHTIDDVGGLGTKFNGCLESFMLNEGSVKIPGAEGYALKRAYLATRRVRAKQKERGDAGDRDAFKARLNTFRCYAWMSVDKYTKAAGKSREEVFDLIATDQI